MFRQKEWPFIGSSGTTYTFTIYPKSAELPDAGGIILLAYTHPRGHRAGYQANILHIGHGVDLSAPLDQQANLECAASECWNCTYALIEPDEKARVACVHDLLQNHMPPCQSKGGRLDQPPD
ncbi:hypothetical protein [Pseudodesulfovibrio sediminis]|uniref:Uncharacterized protein n=1 Tax=Pseudodesulfovibrio sediminis TaxID=2810563 RepID=A0ABN6EPM1_9BACT|nr:hypothetical protein [Pseudodesulfovibrio sediminis]BCS88377.1 hypothetical protein PSDVSF_16190 [Pseudodesulfovibrio sediminis]